MSWWGRPGVLVFAISICGILQPAHAQTVLLTDAGAIASPSVIDFNSVTPLFGANGPAQIGTSVGRNITWEAQSNQGYLGYAGNWAHQENGSWNSDKTGFTGINSGVHGITFRFLDGPVSAVGGFMNYSNNGDNWGDDPTIEVLGAGDVVLGSYNLATFAPISTPSAINAGAFRGISRASADIHAFRIKNDFIVLDDLTFTGAPASAVPEPGSVLLFLPALGVMAFLRRRRST